jgi:tRNA(Ile)-lysidine synthase
MIDHLRYFLREHHCRSAPLLLGLSGGPDSLVLFFALLHCRREFDYDLHVAHVDHSWRAESAEEARLLESEAIKQGVRFHLLRLEKPVRYQPNLEDQARQTRLEFFQRLCGEYHCQALLLGHHADDQAETVLKRVLEGASLSKLRGLQGSSQIDGMTIWRPWLTLSKKQLLAWSDELPFTPFNDATNQDERFLRARMRRTIIPSLEDIYGRNVSDNLCLLGEAAAELDSYLRERTAAHLQRVVPGPFGEMLDLTRISHALYCPRLEMRYMLKLFCESRGVGLSREALETLVKLVETRAANRQIQLQVRFHGSQNRVLIVDRGKVFLLKTSLPKVTEWQAEFTLTDKLQEGDGRSGWEAVWRGEDLKIVLPGMDGAGKDYHLGVPQLNASYRTLSRWWTEHDVPAFLRHCVPVVWRGDRLIHEFLTGKVLPSQGNSLVGPRIALHLSPLFGRH